MVIYLNKGERTFHLKPGVDKEGKPVKRELLPASRSGSIEATTQEQIDELKGYPDVIDAEKASKPVADKIKELTAERDELKGQVTDLQKRLKKYEKE